MPKSVGVLRVLILTTTLALPLLASCTGPPPNAPAPGVWNQSSWDEVLW